MGCPRISVVTPSFNQAKFLEQAIRSVFDQGYPNIEYVIIDGGSTDGSVDIIKKYATKLAYWISEPDTGQSNAINKGWGRATGEILAWLNADDWYMQGALSFVASHSEAHPDIGVVYGDSNWVDEAGNLLFRQRPPEFDYPRYVINCNNYIPSGSSFIKASVFQEIGGLDESLHYTMDQDYWLRCGLIAGIVHIPEVLSSFRVYPDAKTWRNPKGRAQDIIRIYEKLFNRDDLPSQIRGMRNQAIARAYLSAANHYLMAGEYLSFCRYFWDSIRTSPLWWSRIRAAVLLRAIIGEHVHNIMRKTFRLHGGPPEQDTGCQD